MAQIEGEEDSAGRSQASILASPWPALATAQQLAETRGRGYISHVNNSDINRRFSTGL